MACRIHTAVVSLFLLSLAPMPVVAADTANETLTPSVCKAFTPTLTTKSGSTTLDSAAVVDTSRQRQEWIRACSGTGDCAPLAPKVTTSEGKTTLTLEQVLEMERLRQIWMAKCAGLSGLRPIEIETPTGAEKPEPAQFQPEQPRQEPDPDPLPPVKPIVIGSCPGGYTHVSPSAPVAPGNLSQVIRAVSEEDEGASVTLNWRPGFSGKTADCAYVTPPDSYRICAFRGTDCYSTGARQIWNIPANQTELTVTMNDGFFQGEDFHWAVMACSEDAYCGDFSVHQPIRYMLPPPTSFWVSTIVRNELDPERPFSEVTFRWSSVYRAELYFLCVTTQQPDQCVYLKTSGSFGDPYIKSTPFTQYRIDNDVPQFRGKRVTYTVAACTDATQPSELNCSLYQTPKTMNYPDPQ